MAHVKPVIAAQRSGFRMVRIRDRRCVDGVVSFLSVWSDGSELWVKAASLADAELVRLYEIACGRAQGMARWRH